MGRGIILDLQRDALDVIERAALRCSLPQVSFAAGVGAGHQIQRQTIGVKTSRDARQRDNQSEYCHPPTEEGRPTDHGAANHVEHSPADEYPDPAGHMVGIGEYQLPFVLADEFNLRCHRVSPAFNRCFRRAKYTFIRAGRNAEVLLGKRSGSGWSCRARAARVTLKSLFQTDG